MNYQLAYNKIIYNALCENRIKNAGVIYEDHHIIPKCIGGSDNIDNKILLTPKEHYMCHKLLTFIYKNNRKIICAFNRMTTCKKYKISSRDYDYCKKIFISSMIGDLNPSKNKNVADKIRIGNTGKKRTDQSKKHYSDCKKGHTVSKETIIKISLSKSGITLSDVHKTNISNRLKKLYSEGKIIKNHQGCLNPMYGKNRKINNKTCIYCNKNIDIQNYSKYHGENCKFKIIAA